ncbi:AAA family ATPase [Leptospira kmetyi]|nr:AAA family ATPase [Leptospira kmetyi]
MSYLIIENFMGLKKIEIVIKRITVIIGPQAQGKSVINKIVYFCEKFFSSIPESIENLNTFSNHEKLYYDFFNRIFPEELWKNDYFKITYSKTDNTFLTIKNKKSAHGGSGLRFYHSKNTKISYNSVLQKYEKPILKSKASPKFQHSSNYFNSIVKDFYFKLYKNEYYPRLHRTVYIPAGRSFFAFLKTSVFRFISQNVGIDYFIAEFGALYENYYKSFYQYLQKQNVFSKFEEAIISKILNGKYAVEKDIEYLKLKDSRKIELTLASSGQQEVLPLIMMLIGEQGNSNSYSFIGIEEPEAHLFPDTQRVLINLLGLTYQFNGNMNCLITTHSPYILASINMLINIKNSKPMNRNYFKKKYPEYQKLNGISFNDVSAYSILNGKANTIMNEELLEIDPGFIDKTTSEFLNMTQILYK